MDTALLRAELYRDEGCVPYAYQDSTPQKYWTIGVGFLIDERTSGRVPQPVIDFWLDFLITKLVGQLQQAFPWFADLDEIRQRVIANMAYQMGIAGVQGFHHMVDAIERKDYDAAADAMADSAWAKTQSPQRAERLIIMMRTGQL